MGEHTRRMFRGAARISGCIAWTLGTIFAFVVGGFIGLYFFDSFWIGFIGGLVFIWICDKVMGGIVGFLFR